MSSYSRTAVSADLGLGLEDPEHLDDIPVRPRSVRGQRGGDRDLPAGTYELVPDGDESEHMDFDAELTELLSQA